MAEILHQLIGSLFHCLQVLYIPSGAGFLPSTVSVYQKHQHIYGTSLITAPLCTLIFHSIILDVSQISTPRKSTKFLAKPKNIKIDCGFEAPLLLRHPHLFKQIIL